MDEVGRGVEVAGKSAILCQGKKRDIVSPEKGGRGGRGGKGALTGKALKS